MLERIFAWISEQLVLVGYPIIVLIMLLESLILALPSEVVLPFIGFLVYEGQFNLWLAVLAATVGSLIGSLITYEMSRKGGRNFLRRYGKYMFLNERHLDWSEALYLRYGEKMLFLSRLVPVVRQLISIPAGTTATSRSKFLIYTFAGSFLWNFLLIYAGFLLGKEWMRIGEYTQPIDVLAMLLIGALITWYLFKEIEKRTFLKEVRPRLVKHSRRLKKRLIEKSRRFKKKRI